METSFEQALPPRERLELTVDDMFRSAQLYDGATTQRITDGSGIVHELLEIPRDRATAQVVRELDGNAVPQSYVVMVTDKSQMSRGIAGLAWRPQDKQPPRIFAPRMYYDEDHEVTALLPEWLRAHAHHEDQTSMPPNPFNPVYGAQEVTVGTLHDEQISSEELENVQIVGLLAAYAETYMIPVSPSPLS